MNQIICVPGRMNLSDPASKADSPISDSLHLSLSEVFIPFDFPGAELANSDRRLG